MVAEEANVDDTLEDESPQEITKLLNRVARIKGQVGGIERMLKEEAYCIDLINQIHSVERALQGLSTEIMDKHLKSCVRDAIQSDDPYDEREKIEEFMNTVRDFLEK